MKNIIVYAPRIHTGGGYTLLKEFIQNSGASLAWIALDQRVKAIFPNNIYALKRFIAPTFWSLLWNEYYLFKTVKPKQIVFSFHGLPPMFPLSEKVIVFFQNRLLFEPELRRMFPLWPRFRMFCERLWLKWFWRSSMEILVQTPSMAAIVKEFLGDNYSKVNIASFHNNNIPDRLTIEKKYNFIYVASGDPHKNHERLLDAWIYLSENGVFPSLVLTICDKQYPEIMKKIDIQIKKFNLHVFNVGHIENMEELYSQSHALIFPSLSESLGLPLLEASLRNLPIVASEKDFVRDSVVPVETFDPLSHVSIARSVMRFMKINENHEKIHNTKDIIDLLIS